jgi:hypothetical protein
MKRFLTERQHDVFIERYQLKFILKDGVTTYGTLVSFEGKRNMKRQRQGFPKAGSVGSLTNNKEVAPAIRQGLSRGVIGRNCIGASIRHETMS